MLDSPTNADKAGNLVVGSDLSARSDRAVERAVMIAKECGLNVTITHVIDDDIPASIAEKQCTTAKKALQDQVDSLQDCSGIAVDIEVTFGKAHVELDAATERNKALAAVVGTHARWTPFHGTTVERFVRYGESPCLVVATKPSKPYRRVMLGIDFSTQSKAAVSFVTGLVPNAEATFIHAYHIPYRGLVVGERELSAREEQQFLASFEEERERFMDGMSLTGISVEWIVEEGSPQAVLRKHLEDLKPDLLVIGTHGRTGIARSILGSVAEDFLTKSPCDVAAVKS